MRSPACPLDPPDLVILDVMLPGMDGFEVLGAIRATDPDLPVIMLTARGEVADRVRGLDLGATDYLGKPFAFAELLARIRARSDRFQRPELQLRQGRIRNSQFSTTFLKFSSRR